MAAIQTPTGPQDVASINAARESAVSSGQNPYAGAGATNLSNSVGLQNAPNSGIGIPQTPVITSGAASDDLAGIQAKINTLNQAIQAQSAKMASDKAARDAQSQVQADKTAATQAAADKAKIDQQNADTKRAALTSATGASTTSPSSTSSSATATPGVKSDQPYQDTTGGNPNNWRVITKDDGSQQVVTKTQNADGTSAYTPVSSNDLTLAKSQASLDQANSDFQAEADKVTQTINNIASGVIPLTPAEQAQVDGLRQSYSQLIDQQNQQNTGAVGTATIRGYQTGSAEYDPMFAVKTIGAIVTAGANKISDLNIKEAAAVADLTDTIKNNDIAAVKDAWDTYQSAFQTRTGALKDTIDNAQAAIKNAQDAQQKITDGINTIATEAAKNGADPKTLAAIAAAPTVTAAITAAGDSLQTGTGQIGDYLQYKRDATARGLTPLDYATWKAKDDAAQANQKYSEAYATEAGKNAADVANGGGGGYNGTTAKEQQSMEKDFKSTLLKEFSSRSGTYGLNDAKVSQANKLAALFNQGYDPKTGNYNINAQQYGELAEGLASLISGSSSGASDADVAMLKAATAKGQWNKVYTYVTGSPANGSTQAIINSLASSVEREALQASSDRAADEQKLIGLAPTDLDPARRDALIKEQGIEYIGIKGVAKTDVNTYVKSHPDQADSIAKMYEVPGATDEAIWQYLQQQ